MNRTVADLGPLSLDGGGIKGTFTAFKPWDSALEDTGEVKVVAIAPFYVDIKTHVYEGRIRPGVATLHWWVDLHVWATEVKRIRMGVEFPLGKLWGTTDVIWNTPG